MKLFGRRQRGNRMVRRSLPASPPLRARLLARARASRRYALALAAAAAVSGAVYAGARFLTTSPRFAITEMRWNGLRHTTVDELARRVTVARGQNIFRADLRGAAIELAGHPWIADVHLHRELPGRVTVDVTEREAAAVVHAGAFYLCDADGRLFKRATLDEADGMVVITGLAREQLSNDQPGAEALVREALATLYEWRRNVARPALSEIFVHPMLGVSVFTRRGASEIRLGRGDIARKTQRYDLVRGELARRGEQARLIVLDSVTRPDRVAVRLKPVAEGG
jgi:cell division septal protein FtsQ